MSRPPAAAAARRRTATARALLRAARARCHPPGTSGSARGPVGPVRVIRRRRPHAAARGRAGPGIRATAATWRPGLGAGGVPRVVSRVRAVSPPAPDPSRSWPRTPSRSRNCAAGRSPGRRSSRSCTPPPHDGARCLLWWRAGEAGMDLSW